MSRLFKRLVNVHGDLFATTACFAAQALIKFGSSLILTRILSPEAYGLVSMVNAIAFVVEMIADVGVLTSVIRQEGGDAPEFLDTAWTLKFARSLLNAAAMLIGAPLLSALYGTYDLTEPLRVFSVWFIIGGLESMAFPLAIRQKRARVVVYSELVAVAVAAVFTIAFCLYFHSYWGIILGTLVNRAVTTGLSHAIGGPRPRFLWDRAAASVLLGYGRFAVPSGMLTLFLSQFDKLVFLRLFDLKLLGIYSLANNVASPVESLVLKISQSVLYPRCAHHYRQNRDALPLVYYTENVKLHAAILFMPAAVGGAAGLLIALFYDSRYAEAAFVLHAAMLRIGITSLSTPAEDLLMAAGEMQVLLIGNILRATWTVAGSLIGYRILGFPGFIYGLALCGLPQLGYYLWLQYRKRLMVIRFELYRAGFAIAVTVVVAVVGAWSMGLLRALRAHLAPG